MNRDCMESREELLRKIQMLTFALIETNLYLDTHPMDQAALAYYHKHRDLLAECEEIYAENYGPLNPGQVTSKNRWTWIDDPWPWEMEA